MDRIRSNKEIATNNFLIGSDGNIERPEPNFLVVDAETGAPIEGATVTSGGGATDTTDANGDYLLNDVPAGLAIVEVTREGYNPLTQSVTLVEDDVAELNFDLVKTP